MKPTRLSVDQHPAHTVRQMRERGFTLIELIMVIVILGVLAVFAAPRIINTDDFNARGFHDETLALLRYAQKAAVAQRRTVCVAFTTTTVSLAMAKDPATIDCSTPATAGLTGPRGENPATIPSTSRGVTFNGGAPGGFSFNGLGQPISTTGTALAAQTVIQINNADNVYVEAVTGYVHE
jgi:MSHA pilin protein MshC